MLYVLVVLSFMLLGKDKWQGRKPVHNEYRYQHTRVFGKTGVGKSIFLERNAIADIYSHKCVIFFDPHGSPINTILERTHKERRKDIILLDFSDQLYPPGIKLFHDVEKRNYAHVANSLVDTIMSFWKYDDIAIPEMDQYISNGVLAVLDSADPNLISLKYFITYPDYRSYVLEIVTNKLIKDYREADFNEFTPDAE